MEEDKKLENKDQDMGSVAPAPDDHHKAHGSMPPEGEHINPENKDQEPAPASTPSGEPTDDQPSGNPSAGEPTGDETPKDETPKDEPPV